MAVNSVRHGFYAIIKVKMSHHLHPHSTLLFASGKRSGEFAYFCMLTWSFDAQYCDQNLTMLALFYELFISYIYIEIKYYSLKNIKYKN